MTPQATSKIENKTPFIEITLTTFTDDENGEITLARTGTVKIDGEGECAEELCANCSIFKSTIVKNLLVLSFGHFLLLISFDSLSNLQSTINTENGIGIRSLVVLYGVFIASSFFLPTILIKSMGCKKTMVLAMIGICPYVLANMYPTWSTLIPTAVVCGLVSGPLWSARSTYLNQISHKYAAIQRTSAEIMNAWFFSISTTFQQNTEIWGNLLSYYVLKDFSSSEFYLSKSDLGNCGYNFCDNETFRLNATLHLPSSAKRYVLIGIFAVLAMTAAFFIAFFLDVIEMEESEVTQDSELSSSNLFAAYNQMKKFDQVLLVPLSIYTGLADGFYNADYTKTYVACAWGIPYVGAVSICYGIVSVLIDSAGGPCVLILGRAGLFFLAACAHLAMFLALCLWTPESGPASGFFLIAGAHGIGNGVWMSQLVAMYGVIFKKNEEAAFSCFYFLNSLGYLIAYSYSSYLCTNVKLLIPLAMLILGLVCYLVVEVRMVRKTLMEHDLRRKREREIRD